VKKLLAALALLTSAACGDQAVTQYAGTVMSEASPEIEGSLRLTFFERTDTSLSGVVELRGQVQGTGSAYAWYEGPELRIVTAGARTADTILWTSRLADEGLGGRYEVTGG